LNVLSVDWDYFFPDLIPYDWGHKEVPFFKEAIWSLRASNRNLFTGAYALDEVSPRGLESFWEKFSLDGVTFLSITDSHVDLAFILRELSFGPYDIYNCDQHHDLGYSYGQPSGYDCGNWAYRVLQHEVESLKVNSYNLIYPSWRLERPEHLEMESVDSRVKIFYEIPKDLPSFDFVFICRSSAWTPSWADNHWLQFIHWWSDHYKTLYFTSFREEFVEKARYPNIAEAHVLKRDAEKELAELWERAKQKDGKKAC